MKQLKFLDELVTCFEKLPGVGHKTALRYAYYIVEKYSLEDIKKVSDVLIDTFSKIQLYASEYTASQSYRHSSRTS
jgi:recombinational DNA repair protein RecR